ncbi:MAG: thioredoxin family protein [Chloroflexi bacterium]|nr:thioredoxin family protein [Chloroflexota bacterium]
MAITKERFEQGLTYDQWKAQMTKNREKHEANEAAVRFDAADLEVFRNLPEPLNLVAIGEDWCGDVIAYMPLVGRLAAESNGKINLRVFLRDQNLDLMDQYLKDDKYRSIPVFAVFDRDFRDLGHFIERPESVTAERMRLRAELYAQNPEFGSPDSPTDQLSDEIRQKLYKVLNEARDKTAEFGNREVVRALREIAERATPARA